MNGSELARLAVHDVKNALGSLEAQLERLMHAPQADGAREAWLHCTDLRRRLVTLLTLYGDSDGPLRPQISDEDPRELLHTLVGHCRHTLQRPVELHVGPCAHAPAFFYLDRHLVRLALDAALHNACRYAHRHVWLDAASDDGALVFSIEDDGPGPQDSRPDDASTRLGTVLCRSVAQAHASEGRLGDARLSARPGGGARFELRLF